MTEVYRTLDLEHVPFAFLDVETTGLDPGQGHRICEIAVVRTVGRVETRRFSSLVNPGRPIGLGAQAVNHITDQMVADAPRFAELLDDLRPMLGRAVIVAHNVPFDVGFVNQELHASRQPHLDNLAVDTLLIARRAYQFPRNSLDALTFQLGLAASAQHRALGDVLAVKGLLWWLVEDLRAKGIRTLGDLLDIQDGRHPVVKSSASIPPELLDAMHHGYSVQLRYESSNGGVSSRRVDPIRIDERLGRRYLVAYCHLRQAERSFRVDRIKKIDVLRGSGDERT